MHYYLKIKFKIKINNKLMGNCAGICKSKILGLKGDIILDKNTNNETGKNLETDNNNNNIQKIIYLQREIKKFLKKLNSSKPKLPKKSKPKSPVKKKSLSPRKRLKLSKGEKRISSTSKNLPVSQKSKYITYEEDQKNSLLIPTIKTTIMENNNIFADDAFRHQRRLNPGENDNDPRDGPFDGKRRKYPKIKEDLSSYEGEWKNGKRDGFGILCWGEESKFMGQFIDDKVSGYGKLWQDNGDMYRGYWKDFQAEGMGYYQTKKGANFSGEWSEDKQNGFGLENWPKGSSFIGNYTNGSKHGIGILSFENKAEYRGEFDEGIISGIGTFYFWDKRKYHGQWKNNKMHGFGIIIWPSGDAFEGEFVEDKKSGFGIFYNKQKIYMGIWINNKPEGEVAIIDNGKVKKQLWKNGRPIKYLEEGYKTKFESVINEIKNDKKNKIKQTIDDFA